MLPPIRELISCPAYSLPVPARCAAAGSGVTRRTSSLARAGAGALCDGFGTPGAGGEGRAGAALVPEIRGLGGLVRPWPPPGLGATGLAPKACQLSLLPEVRNFLEGKLAALCCLLNFIHVADSKALGCFDLIIVLNPLF